MTTRFTSGLWQLDECGREAHEREIKKTPGGWFLLISAGYPFSQMVYPAEAEVEFKANAQLIVTAPQLFAALAGVIASRGMPHREEYLNDHSFKQAMEAHTRATEVLAKAVQA